MNSNKERLSLLAIIGPGLAIAVAGIGALDITATALAGAKFGLGLLWLPVVVVVFKFALNEGVARWQLATDQTLLEGLAERMPPLFRYVLAVYLIVWAPLVFTTLVQLSGVSADLMWPLEDYAPRFLGQQRSPLLWSGICVVMAAGLSLWGGYRLFEKLVFCSAATMFVLTVASAVMLIPTSRAAFSFALPLNSPKDILDVFGGVGGTLSILLYGYWIRDRGRTNKLDDSGPKRNWLTISRIDLVVSYAVTLIFALCMIVIIGGAGDPGKQKMLEASAAAQNDKPKLKDVLELASTRAAEETGLTGAWHFAFTKAFSISIFATVASSLLGMMQGGAYMFSDVLGIVLRKPPDKLQEMTNSKSKTYLRVLCVLAVMSFPLIFLPVEAIAKAAMFWGALIIPFLAIVLLFLNNRADDMKQNKNRWLSNTMLSLCLGMFVFLVCCWFVV